MSAKNRPLLYYILFTFLITLSMASCEISKTTNLQKSNEITGTTAITETKGLENNIFDLRNLTPAKVLETYMDSLKRGDEKIANSLLSKRFLSIINNGKGYDAIQPQKISKIEIKVNDKKTSSDTEVNYTLSFVLDKDSEPPFFMDGKGEHFYFVKLISEGNCWKIDGFATSP